MATPANEGVSIPKSMKVKNYIIITPMTLQVCIMTPDKPGVPSTDPLPRHSSDSRRPRAYGVADQADGCCRVCTPRLLDFPSDDHCSRHPGVPLHRHTALLPATPHRRRGDALLAACRLRPPRPVQRQTSEPKRSGRIEIAPCSPPLHQLQAGPHCGGDAETRPSQDAAPHGRLRTADA